MYTVMMEVQTKKSSFSLLMRYDDMNISYNRKVLFIQQKICVVVPVQY